MSISVSFNENIFSLDKLNLPTRYYYFHEQNQNFLKFLSIGEGVFPKDKIRTDIKLQNSDVVFTTESATKVYSSTKEFGVNKIHINLNNSNLEYINDELILYKDAKFLQLLKIKADAESTFFYGDILSHGRSYENFDFSLMSVKNSFFLNDTLEYLEKYQVEGDELKSYIARRNSTKRIFSKIYVKTNDNEHFLDTLAETKIHCFSYTSNKKMLIGVVSDSTMSNLKKQLLNIWKIYRIYLNKKEFNLGKQ
ncbi:MAG TPA: urease accessory protein UreD [Epsilonproteobacteria bacterium]|nr:urease accessory protein UreD [Campylobacterota bacterium]HHD79273.1 urease accessory protein UreD [Campylobacterota bacterium]